MKIFTLLFSIYFFSLAILPCGDSHDTALDKEFHTTYIASDHHDHEHTAETCSPLCVCQCCSIHMTFETHSINLVVNQFSYQMKLPIEIGSPKKANSPFWQPPKIA